MEWLKKAPSQSSWGQKGAHFIGRAQFMDTILEFIFVLGSTIQYTKQNSWI